MQKLEGLILSYTDGGTPKFRVFSNFDSLERFVGKFYLNNFRSDSHWVDAIIDGEITVVDTSQEIEYDEVKKETQHEGERSTEVSTSDGT